MVERNQAVKKLNYKDIKDAIAELNLENSVICLHSSLKSFGYIENGADALIQAFLDSGCTLVVPAFTYDYDAPPPSNAMYEQNAYDYDRVPDLDTTKTFNENSNMVVRDMGAIPARILHYSSRVRGKHPLNSFAAIGPKAEEIIKEQDFLNVYGPYKKAYRESKVYIILAGVDLTKATPIHYAEEKAGRHLFRRWAKYLDNPCVEVEVGSCSEGFEKLSSVLAPIEKRVLVGSSQWRVFPFKSFIDIASEAIRNDQSITHCEDDNCTRCNHAVKGGPILVHSAQLKSSMYS
jgi:aminoglycoside N3'-acetyltransferase